jgi:hypothetical protein
MRSGTWLGICSWETGEGRRSEFLQCFQHSGNNKFRKELLAGEILGNKRKSNNGGTFLKECSLSHYCIIFKKSKMCEKKKKLTEERTNHRSGAARSREVVEVVRELEVLQHALQEGSVLQELGRGPELQQSRLEDDALGNISSERECTQGGEGAFYGQLG